MYMEAYLNIVTIGKKRKMKKFTERGQGILDLERRGEHLGKERDSRKEEDEHFMRYDKNKQLRRILKEKKD